ncbi:oligopeptide transport system permease protein [Deinococcus reticulitermitis]|uniref:Oligopeptide transport system permease protein n=1 Tax=Deinococcus reticulitermitis TaxID=856736 RepID=A0A1H6ZEV8_9DEIO|nr:hypothetical protein [Deinococcus reticulitermitis]SEJ48212.1 oligopeptide transport system permease protein [Deinococcus reticulitermitis]
MRRALGLLSLHFIVLLGVQRTVPLPERLARYPSVLLGLGRPEVFREVLTQAALSASYLGLALLLAWGLAGALRRLVRPALWVLEGTPQFLLLVLGIWGGLSLTLARGADFPLTPWSPLMLGLFTVALTLPVAARASLATEEARRQALAADHTRTARAMGLSERAVERRALRVSLAERAGTLSGEVFGLGLALVVMEGLLQFPGLGNTLYVALQGAFAVRPPGAVPLVPPTGGAAFELQALSGALLLWLLLGAWGSALFVRLALRLDPRPRSGEETR